jgi:hypothetical protein
VVWFAGFNVAGRRRDELDGDAQGHLGSIPTADWACRGWRSRWCAQLGSGVLQSPAVMVTGVARVSVLGKFEQREGETELGFVI